MLLDLDKLFRNFVLFLLFEFILLKNKDLEKNKALI